MVPLISLLLPERDSPANFGYPIRDLLLPYVQKGREKAQAPPPPVSLTPM